MAEQQLFCTFYIGSQYYGVPVADVQEVLLSQPLTGVPLAPAAVAGLMNLRGQIITAVRVRTVLEVSEPPPDEEPMHLVVRHQGGEISLLVDRIGEVIDVAGAILNPPPDTLQGSIRDFLLGIFPLKDQLLLALDIRRVLEDRLCMCAIQTDSQ